jgi:hypothetical protein
MRTSLTRSPITVRNTCRGSNFTDSICNSKQATPPMIRKVVTKLTNAKLTYVSKAVPGADAAFAIGPLIGG